MIGDRVVAALYIDEDAGPYPSFPGVDCWGVNRDARQYRGPNPVVAHPPCQAWGRYRLKRFEHQSQHPWDSARWDRDGAEMLCGPIAVQQVRTYGGVLEHPADSDLWRYANLPRPGLFRDAWGGFTLEVRQGHWGHPSPKPTWLYICGCEGALPDLPKPSRAPSAVESQWSGDRHITPIKFAEFLIGIARLCCGQRVPGLVVSA